MSVIQLTAKFQTYWHVGTGKGAGQGVDALVDKDQLGLPQVSGKMLKGLFRDACFKLEQWEAVDSGRTNQLFGSRTSDSRFETEPGILNFSALRLHEKERAALSHNQALISHLYKTLHSTTIDHKTGSAKEKSLRAFEVVVPIAVYGEIEINPTLLGAHNLSLDEVQAQIKQFSDYITHLGAMKTRGFGEVVWQIETAQEAQK